MNHTTLVRHRALLLAAIFVSSAVASASEDLLAEIRRTWDARAVRITPWRAVIEQHRTIPAGSLDHSRGVNSEFDGHIPPEDTVITSTYTILANPASTRVDISGETYHAGKPGIVAKHEVEVRTAAGTRILNRYGTAERPRYQASIRGPGESLRLAELTPLQQLLPRFWPLGYAWDDLTVSEEVAGYDGRDCVVLYHGLYKLWCDRDRDFSILRMESRRQILKVRYELRRPVGWVPVGWTAEYRGPSGELTNSIAYRVLDVDFNYEMSADQFHLEFPVGTFVFDATKISDGREARFIQRADGRMEPIAPTPRSQ